MSARVQGFPKRFKLSKADLENDDKELQDLLHRRGLIKKLNVDPKRTPFKGRKFAFSGEHSSAASHMQPVPEAAPLRMPDEAPRHGLPARSHVPPVAPLATEAAVSPTDETPTGGGTARGTSGAANELMDLDEVPLPSTPLHTTPLRSAPLRSTPLRSAPLRSTLLRPFCRWCQMETMQQ